MTGAAGRPGAPASAPASAAGDGPARAESTAAVVDLGSNSVKVSCYHVHADGTYKPYHSVGAKTRLGEGLDETGFLGEGPMDRAVGALRLCRDVISHHSISRVLPIATAAVREAGNGRDFLERVLGETGLRFRVLTGEEEALYSYAGAARSLRLPSVVFFDIGGGSLELVSTDGYAINRVMSLPLGALRLTQMHANRRSEFTGRSFELLESHVRSSLPLPSELGIDPGRAVLVGAGGAVRNLAKHDQASRRYPFAKVHNYILDAQSVSTMTERLALLRPYEIAEIESFSRGRAEIITAGASVVNVIMDRYGFGSLVVSAQGLREGTLATSLDFPLAFRGGAAAAMPHTAEIESSVRAACEADDLPAAAAAVADPLIEDGALDGRLRPVLAHSLRYMSMFTSLRNIENVVHLVLDEDSALSHRQQLVSALAIIHTRKKRRARILAERYSEMLGGDDVSGPVRRVGALAELCDVLLATGVRPSVSVRRGARDGKGGRRGAAPDPPGGPGGEKGARDGKGGRRGAVSIALPAAGPGFPYVMFGEACSAAAAALGMRVECSSPTLDNWRLA